MRKIVALALARALTDSGDIRVGTYKIDETITLHVCGTVQRRPDTSYTPTVAIPLKATMALLLQRMGCTREAAADLLVDVMTEALAAESDVHAAAGIAERIEDVESAMARVQAVTGKLPQATRKGATIVKCEVTEVAVEWV